MKMNIRSMAFVFLFAMSASTFAADEPAIVNLRVLSPQIAYSMVLAAVQDCTKRGYKVSAALVDRNGNLSAFLRDPLSGPHTVKISQGKAFTSATSQISTARLASRQDLRFAPGMLLIVGGVPIRFNGHFYGGVAVSGATPEVDEKCAQAGIEAVSDVMEFVE